MTTEVDYEKNPEGIKATTVDSFPDDPNHGEVTAESTSRWQRFKDGFKPMDLSDLDTTNMTEIQIAAAATARAPLQRGLKGRHMQMIAIGGSIGTGLFIGSGGALATGGPAGLLIAYILIGAMLFNTVQALGELAVRFPVSGAFSTFSTRFIDHSWGFAMGWNYALQWLVVLPLELVAASITISYWKTDGTAAATVNPDAWVALFYCLILFINVFGVRGYGEAEFIFGFIKVTAVIGFIILGIVINCGGAPKGGYIGGKYWHDPGAFAHGFKGVCTVFVAAAFAFSGTELVGLAAAESKNPRKTLPRAAKQVFWRITLFYVIALTVVGLLVPYTNPSLGASSDTSASPFVIAIKNAGISGLPSVLNVVVLVAVLSVANSSVFGCSRTLAALAAQRMAPKQLGYIDRKGRPLVALAVSLTFGLLCFLAGSDKHGEVFDWLYAFSGCSSLFTWGSICVCQIRFRRALKVQGVPKETLAFRAQAGVIGSMFGAGLNLLILCLQFWVALFPLGSSPDPAYFFKQYLSVPVVLVMFAGHKLWFRGSLIRSKDIDLFTGMREMDQEKLQLELEEEREYIRNKNVIYRVYRFWC